MSLRVCCLALSLLCCTTAAFALTPNEIGERSTPAPGIRNFPPPLPVGGGGDCDCLDLVLLVDVTGSMGGAINNVKDGIDDIIAHAVESCIDVHAGLVSFKDVVYVEHDLNADVSGVVLAVSYLGASGGQQEPEASDEALREVLEDPGAACTGISRDFTVSNWRAGCCRIAVLITDAHPGGCDDAYTPGVDDAAAQARALTAAGMGVKIGAVFVPTFGDPTGEITPIMTNYSATTGGTFGLANPDGTGTATAINALIDACAGPPPELCCLDGKCFSVTPGSCDRIGGTVVDDCSECTGEVTGACCFHPGGECQVLTMPLCEAAGGAFIGPYTDCNVYTCSATPTEATTWSSVKVLYR